MATSSSQHLRKRSTLAHNLWFTLLCGTHDPVSPMHTLQHNQSILSMLLDLAFMEPAQAIDLVEVAANGRLSELRAKLHLTDVDVNSTRDIFGKNAMHQAAYNGQIKALQLLLQSGADPSITTNFGGNAVNLATTKGHAQAVQLLLQYRADPSTPFRCGGMPLSSARSSGRTAALATYL